MCIIPLITKTYVCKHIDVEQATDHKRGELYRSLNRQELRFRQTPKLSYKQMEIFHQCFQYTPSNLSNFIECSFLLQSIYHFSADKCLKMKLLIDLCTILCRITKECTGLHILSSRSIQRSLCRFDLPWGHVG